VTETTTVVPPALRRPSGRELLNKVPEVTIWFWIIKVLCTTVGESFADWVSNDLGVGLINTALLFTVLLGAVLTWQIRLRRYNPFPYWLTVVALSVTGTLYTDILTDRYHVPLALTTAVCAALLAVVFGVWYARERTLSIHSIVTTPREGFYWLAILVTFALGTAAGDWSLELTGWGPGLSILLPAFLIAAIAIGWRLGANAVLAFWLAYILTRPLGANIGDWLAVPHKLGGRGLGTAVTSAIFLTAILSTVVYLAIKRPDVEPRESAEAADPKRQRLMLCYFAVIAIGAVVVLAVANSRPHASFSAEEEALSAPAKQLSPHEATASFPAVDVAELRTITQGTLDRVQARDHAGAAHKATDLETTWDRDQSRLQPMNGDAWHFLDSEIDDVLSAVRSSHPDAAAERDALQKLLTSLSG
jgi:uncharacterized membrane-anchored protein